MKNLSETEPLKNLEEWEEDVLRRYPDPDSIVQEKSTEEYRNYNDPQRDTVREFYRLNHTYQTYDFVLKKEAEFLAFNKKEMPVWDAFDFLNQLVFISGKSVWLNSFNANSDSKHPDTTPGAF